MRNSKGQFTKGHRSSPSTEFKPGQHWRKRKPYWGREWLSREYIEKQRSAAEIAEQFGITENAILFWIAKHNIPTRSTSEVRAIKHWGQKGEDNPMYGVRGAKHYNWKGGITPERQALYSTLEWAQAVISVWERDKGICQRCGTETTNRRKMHIHHIVPFQVRELATHHDNLVSLCAKCHRFVHSPKNINHEFIKGKENNNGGTV